MEIKASEYIPTDSLVADAYVDIKDTIARARRDESYVTNKQIAMAIIAGLDKYSSISDAEEIAKEINFLAHE